MMKRGFTLIEIMVATILLAMLVTILTMIFNQSSIAWTTGMAAVASLGDAREQIAVDARAADCALLADDGNTVLRVTSVFDDSGNNAGNGGLRLSGEGQFGEMSGRTVMDMSVYQNKARMRDQFDRQHLKDESSSGRTFSIGSSAAAQGRTAWIVGVHSYGPDRKTGGDYSWDDINTLPEEVVK